MAQHPQQSLSSGCAAPASACIIGRKIGVEFDEMVGGVWVKKWYAGTIKGYTVRFDSDGTTGEVRPEDGPYCVVTPDE